MNNVQSVSQPLGISREIGRHQNPSIDWLVETGIVGEWNHQKKEKKDEERDTSV